MRIGLVIADFEMRYSESFKSTARRKYGVEIDSSNVSEIREKLRQLSTNITEGRFSNVRVGYDFEIDEVKHLENLLDKLVDEYSRLLGVTSVPSRTKIFSLINSLRESDLKDKSTDLAQNALNQVFSPNKAGESKKLSKSEEKEKRVAQKVIELNQKELRKWSKKT
jgi:hypothetical protein